MNSPANRLNLDYRQKAQSLKSPPTKIIDFHSHLLGREVLRIFREAAQLYGVTKYFSMTPWDLVADTRNVLGEDCSFISIPDFQSSDRKYAFGAGYAKRVEDFYRAGSRIAKFWSAPRLLEFSDEDFAHNPFRINGALRRDGLQCAVDHGMALMFHVADPDTWFQTRYANEVKFGRKSDHYADLMEILEIFDVPVVLAHMGGYPEDLEFLSQLLERFPKLYIDSSATKWVVREISKHPLEAARNFFERWSDRIIFGSDIVTSEQHLSSGAKSAGKGQDANSPEEAFDLYASRYYALRLLWESDYNGPSPIADPDLKMTEPDKYSELDGPNLRGLFLPSEILQKLYHDNAQRFLASF